MDKGVIIEELNTLLRGTYMGIRSFEHYIQKIKNPGMKKTFQKLQQQAKDNAAKIAARIQDLGGVPADSEGFTGSMHSFMHKITAPEKAAEIIHDAMEGIKKYGILYSEKLVRGDIDGDTKKFVEEVIDTYRNQLDILEKLLDACSDEQKNG